EINNISIHSPITFNNKYGILMVLMNLPGKNKKNVNVNISNHIDDTSLNGLLLSGVSDKNYLGPKLQGKIQVNNPIWKNSINKYNGLYKFKYMPPVEVINPEIFNDN